MQAPLSYTAFGEHFVSDLPPSHRAATHPSPFDADADAAAAVSFAGLDKTRSWPETRVPYSSVPPFLSEADGGGGRVHGVADGAGLAHDAGNLLGAIRLYCDLLALPGVLRGEHRHYVEELRRLTARSGSLIDRLLQPEAPGTVIHGAQRLRLADAVMECRGMLTAIAGPESLLIAVAAEAREEVAVSREDFERILVNLTKNAAEAARSPEGAGQGFEREEGTITVRVRSVKAWGPDRVRGLVLSVEDRGRGMDAVALRAACSGKGSASPDGTLRPGRGLGLCVVRELTARTGGQLRMRSRPGQGTTVDIVWAALPLEQAESG